MLSIFAAMAPTMGFRRFMDDVHETMFPMASLDWHKPPLINPIVSTIDGIQKDAAQSEKILRFGEKNLAGNKILAAVNTHQSITDPSNQNKVFLEEKANATKW